MKNLFKTIMVFSLVLLGSCEKENLTETQPNSITSINGIRYISAPSDVSVANRTAVVNGMLEFDDMSTFLNTISSLEQQVITYDANFLKSWGHLNDNDIEDKEDQLGYDPQQPLIDFENQFSGFISLRSVVEADIKNWLDNNILDDINDPEDNFIFDDEIRSVLNPKGQVKIGRSLFQMTRFGSVEITDGNFSTLALVESSDASQINLPTVVISGGYYGSSTGNNTQSNPPGTPTDCRTHIDDSHYYYPSSDRRIKAQQKLKGYSTTWGSKIKAKTIHYKKKNGNWKKRRGQITAQILGESVNQYCNLPANQNKTDSGNKVKVKAVIQSSASSNNEFKTKYQHLRTIHKKDNTSYTDYFYQ